jgi:head-tail adaptor
MNLYEEITVYQRAESGADRYGDPELTEDAGTRLPAAVQPVQEKENDAAQTRLTSIYRVTVDPAAELDGLSRVEWRSRSFEVLGEPALFTYRNGAHHQEFLMREVQG